ncbi:MAG: HAMP domain-containing sensor histidine kinase [Clostridiales bacterium]|nr:HAMP domain-containing sensor histidine kinase [Clostridiales bacterium]
MSSVTKNKKKEKEKMSSIAVQLSLFFFIRRLGTYLGMDVLVLFLSVIGWCYGVEVQQYGRFRLLDMLSRQFHKEGGTFFYDIYPKSGEVFHADMTLLLQILKYMAIGVLVFQLLLLIQSVLKESYEIRKRLRPLKEMALKTEQISSLAFNESKFHQLEDAISQVNPNDSTAKVQVGDKELKGLEMAVNRLIERMRDTYRQQSRFVSDASHELRTPVAVIKGYADMLDRWGKEDSATLDEGIAAIKHESEHMSKLIEQLLFLARGDSGRNQMKFEEFSLSGMVREVMEESQMIDERHSYRYLDKGEVRAYGDITMLKQTVRILAENARKYSNDGDEIIFCAGETQEEVFFYVQDCGQGMNDKEVSHIFERFYRSDEARNSKTGGSGLGLSIAKWIVDKHKGHFDVLSRKELGTRIRVILPQKKEESPYR